MRRTPPKYKQGTKVFHLTAHKWGRIELAFISDTVDGKFYENRYYVKHSGEIWSVPERFLSSRKPKVRAVVVKGEILNASELWDTK